MVGFGGLWVFVGLCFGSAFCVYGSGVLGLVVPVVGLGLFLGCFYLRVICVIQILRWFGLGLVICVGLRCVG